MDETPQLDRIHFKDVPRKVIFEIFEKDVILAIFEVSDLVVFRKNNVYNMCSPPGSNSRRLISAIVHLFKSRVNHYIHSATPR